MAKKMRWIGVVAITTILLSIYFFYTHTRNLYHYAACEKNLAQVFRVLQIYTNESPQEQFPPLSTIVGRLMFDESSLHPDQLHGLSWCLISLDHPDAQELFRIAEESPHEAFDDHSYWYLGYTLLSERVLQSFIEDYKVAFNKGGPVPEVDEIFPEAKEVVEQRRERRRLEIEAYLDQVEAQGGDRARAKAYDGVPIGDDERNYRRTLRNGIERFLIYEIGNPVVAIKKQAEIPVMIERPELHGDGGHVLFLDGHVEFIPYPGKFPMTKEYIAGLRQLDALGEPDPAN